VYKKFPAARPDFFMLESNFESRKNTQEEEKQRKFLEWLGNELKNYEAIFNLSDEDLRDKKILEIGAGDRRFAATCILNNITREVYSLEPALSGEDKPGYASQGFLDKVMEGLPADMRRKIEEKTLVTTAEQIPVEKDSFDLVIGRSVPFENIEQLENRLRELFRVGKEIRLYPVHTDNYSAMNIALNEVAKDLKFNVQFKTIVEEDIKTEDGIQHIQEDVVILRKN